MMELVTASVNEAERRKIIFEAIQNLEAANDSWEKSGVSLFIFVFLHIFLFFHANENITFKCIKDSIAYALAM